MTGTGQATVPEPGADADRFARQRIIPGWDQSRLAAATVIVIGVGALGNEVAKNLALAGVGRLVLCDPDVVSVSNLSRTMLFGSADVGTPKVAAAAAALRRLAPGMTAEPRAATLVSGVGLGELADAALVIGCVDTIQARVQLLGRCALAGAPLLDGGTSPWGAELRLRMSPDEPCFGCTLTPHQRGASDLPWSCAEPAGGAPQAAAIATTAVAAGWLCAAAFGVMSGATPAWRLLSVDVSDGRAAPVTARRDPACPLHRPLDGPEVASPVSRRATAAEFLATLGPHDEAYTWAGFPMTAPCRRCGAPGDGPAGDAPAGEGDSAAGRCARCGARRRPTTSTRLRDAPPDVTLAALGIAPGEVLPVIAPDGAMARHRLRKEQDRYSSVCGLFRNRNAHPDRGKRTVRCCQQSAVILPSGTTGGWCACRGLSLRDRGAANPIPRAGR